MFLSALKKISRYSNSRIIFEILYFFSNPWKLNSKAEVHRFKSINHFLLNQNNNKLYNHILEIGCGEGHHTEFLSQISKKITSIDISKNAIRKAKKKNITNVEFINKKLELLDKTNQFDLIIASEVIYYIKNVEIFMKKIESLNIKYLITIYSLEYEDLKSLFMDNKFVYDEIIYKKTNWKIIFKK